MKTNKKIDELIADLAPVKVIQSLPKRLLIWGVISLINIVFWVIVLGLRHNLFVLLTSWSFLTQMGLLLLSLFLFGLCVLTLSVPGQSKRTYFTLLSISIFLLFSLILFPILIHSFGNITLYLDPTYSCGINILAISVFPTIALFYLVKIGTVFYRNLISGLILGAASFNGLFSITLHCPITSLMHVLTWHLFPVIILTIIGFFLGHILLKKL